MLAFRLQDGRSATLSLGPASTVLAVDEVRVFSYDLCGRPFALVEKDRTWRRALNGRLLEKGVDGVGGRVRRLISPEEGVPVVEAARREASAALAAIEVGPEPLAHDEAIPRLRRIISQDAPALREDATRFAAIYGEVGILPPDQYLALVLQATRGCSWNACTFCHFYRDVPFRVRTTPEFEQHIADVRAFFGDSVTLRRSIFLGDANALCVSHDRLVPLLEAAARAFPAANGVYAFVDAWTGTRKSVAEYREYGRLGLRRVYVGLESGDPDLLAWLEKAGSPEDAVELVSTLHEAGVAAGVIVLIGAGGERFFAPHVERTVEALSRMGLGPSDIVYFSELVEKAGLEYARRAAALAPLAPARAAEQRRAIAARFRPADAARPPRVSAYDIREFVY